MGKFEELYECNLSDPSTVVGTGAFSSVHKCTCRKDGKAYAVKVINVEKLTASGKMKVEREASICQMLKHKNIVQMKEFLKEPKRYYLVFELVTGGELFEEIVTRSFYNEQDASACISEILLALKECHSKNIIHRDLKPENLLLADKTRNAPTKLTDFGLAVMMENGPNYFGFAGTPGYLSPEVCHRVPYTTAVDIWAAGVIMYILLVGYPPFWHDDHQILYEQIKAGEYDFPSPEWDSVTEHAKDLIRCMLELNPSKRITVKEALEHPWIKKRTEVASSVHRQQTLEELRRFNARRKLKGGIRAMMSIKRLTHLTSQRSQKEAAADVITSPTPDTKALTTQNTMVANESETASDILALNNHLLDAISSGNWKTYKNLVDPSLTCFEPEAQGCLVKGLDFHKYYFDLPKAATATHTTVVSPQARVMGDVAVVTYLRLTQYVDSTGTARTKKSEETRIWQRTIGVWRNVHFHRSEVAH